jgi:hypothetical protein
MKEYIRTKCNPTKKMDEKVEELSPVDENVFKGTNFFALCK